jgi:CheY-like chemotaxis protein
VTVSILVVDDESDVAELFRQHFRRGVQQGTYAMHFANSGEDALGKLAGGVEPTLIAILSDINNMPGMDGLDLLGEIKQRYPEMPVMMVTAYGDDERRRSMGCPPENSGSQETRWQKGNRFEPSVPIAKKPVLLRKTNCGRSNGAAH